MTNNERHLFEESKRFEAALPALLSDYRGKWVLFREGRVQAAFDRDDEAEREAVRRFGRDGACVIAPVGEEAAPASKISFIPLE